MIIHMSVVSYCVVTYTNQVFWQKSENDGAFFLVGCERKNRGESKPENFENLTIVACQRKHFRVFCMI